MSIFIKRILLAVFIISAGASAVHAQVNQDELRQELPPIVFINYEGPYFRIDTREQIRQLGAVLGRQIAASLRAGEAQAEGASIEARRTQPPLRLQAGALNRYFVIHSASAPENGKMDADIFGIGVDAAVDHVRNLRWIIQGYLQEAYGYNESDAALLAEYITIYNAVFRGNWDYFVQRYKQPVIGNLIRERAGLSIRFDEWPGRTMMLIPLGHGGLSSIDTAAITDRRVIEELRREDDMGIQQRQDMVSLMEREAEEAERQAAAERETARRGEQQAAQERQQAAQERQQAAQERQQAAQERQQVQEDQQEGRITEQEARQAEEEIAAREQEAEQQEQAAAAREQEAERYEEEAAQHTEEAQRLEDFAEQRTDAAQQQRQEIARDQQAAITGDTGPVLYGVRIERTAPAVMGRLVRLNSTGRELRRSPLDLLHVRTVTFVSGRIIAIAGENAGPGAVRLIEINQNTLEMARQGEDDIQTGSLLWVNGNDLYAITIDLSSGQCFLGRFDTNLVLRAKSEARVHPDANVIIQQGRLLTQREDGSSLMLNPADLTEAR